MSEHSFEGHVTITGAPGTGKTSALRARRDRLLALEPNASIFDGSAPGAIARLAFEVLRACGIDAKEIDDVEASLLFCDTARGLLALEWDHIVSGQLDPEVPGLRSPARFLASAFRLVRKLIDASIPPDEFLERSLSGATSFYAKPPNFAHPELLRETKDVYRDSLDVTAVELNRQYEREIDLAKILARLYSSYLDRIRATGTMTSRDATYVAIERARPNALPFRYAFVDNAEELTTAQLKLLQALFGESLSGVTFAGDAGSATNTFRGARPDRVFSLPAERIELVEQHRSPVGVELACAQLTHSKDRPRANGVRPTITLHRARSEREEAYAIADRVRALLDAGSQPNQIAVVFRTVADVQAYEAALLDRGVPALVAGDVNVFNDRRALDALALLWNAWDPFRHDWMLRTLAGPSMALSDASLEALCSEPPDAQTPLFAIDDEPSPTARSGRWDPKRDLRLGWNVVRGDRDNALSDTAATRLRAFRAMRERWLKMLGTQRLEKFVRAVWKDALACVGPPNSAAARAQERLLQRLLSRLVAYERTHPGASLGDVVAYAEERGKSDLETCEDDGDPTFVPILSIDATRGRDFEHVIIGDVRAGSFPRWYVPDAFLFSPLLGMIPKENVGDARASRTAKFSYYIVKSKARENYNAEERRAFVYALRRARSSVFVSTSGKPTRGVTAPEFFEELRNAQLPGTEILP